MRLCCIDGDATSTAQLIAGSQLDDGAIFLAGGNAVDVFEISYNFDTPRTLTYGGAMDRIEVELTGVIPGGLVTITIYDSDWNVIVQRPTTDAGIFTFPLSDFSEVDLNMATRLEVRLSAFNEAGTFEISDIRLRGSGYWGPARTVNFVGDFVAIEVPPVPSPPLSWRLTDPEGAWLYRTEMAITRADDGGIIEPCAHADWSEAAGLGGEIAGVIFMGVEPTPFIDTNFELTVDLSTAIRLGSIPQIVGEPSLTTSPFGFLITFPVALTDEAGNELGRSETRILFDVHEGQPARMENVTLAPGGSALPGWTNGFVLAFVLDVIDVVDLEEPLFEATWIADWSAQSVTHVAGPSAVGPHDTSVLSAWPSVTREGTQIRADLPFAVDGVIEILDVSGRRVRALSAPRGAPSVYWDGRDDSGALTGSGLYFARLDRPETRTTRILRVR